MPLSHRRVLNCLLFNNAQKVQFVVISPSTGLQLCEICTPCVRNWWRYSMPKWSMRA